MKQILTIGGILAAYSILFALAMKFILPPGVVLSGMGMLINFIIGMIIVIFLGRKFLRPEFPSLNYGQALKYIFPAIFLSYVLGTVTQTALFSNDQKMKDATLEFGIGTVEKTFDILGSTMGQNEAEIAIEKEKAIAELKANADRDYGFQWSKLPLNLFTGVFMSLINALIASIFVRYKNQSA